MYNRGTRYYFCFSLNITALVARLQKSIVDISKVPIIASTLYEALVLRTHRNNSSGNRPVSNQRLSSTRYYRLVETRSTLTTPYVHVHLVWHSHWIVYVLVVITKYYPPPGLGCSRCFKFPALPRSRFSRAVAGPRRCSEFGTI